MSPTGSEHFVLLNEVLIHLEYNPSINNIPGIKERFWDCVVIDGFINNNDRNNGNWGILRNKSGDVLSPIYVPSLSDFLISITSGFNIS